MDKDKAQKLAKKKEDSLMAAEEILALKLRYHNAADQTYTFECEGKTVQGTFDAASLGVRPPNLYRIKLIAPSTTVVNGPSYIIDRHGQRVKAGANTEVGGRENHITIETLAVKPP